MKLLVVCHGNVCRSPASAAVLRAELPQGWDVRSVGLHATAGVAAKKMRVAMASLGYDLTAHKPTQLREADLGWADMVLYMDRGNLKRLQAFGAAVDKLQPLGAYVGLDSIKDPGFMSGASAEFASVVELLVRASKACARALTGAAA